MGQMASGSIEPNPVGPTRSIRNSASTGRAMPDAVDIARPAHLQPSATIATINQIMNGMLAEDGMGCNLVPGVLPVSDEAWTVARSTGAMNLRRSVQAAA